MCRLLKIIQINPKFITALTILVFIVHITNTHDNIQKNENGQNHLFNDADTINDIQEDQVQQNKIRQDTALEVNNNDNKDQLSFNDELKQKKQYSLQENQTVNKEKLSENQHNKKQKQEKELLIQTKPKQNSQQQYREQEQGSKQTQRQGLKSREKQIQRQKERQRQKLKQRQQEAQKQKNKSKNNQNQTAKKQIDKKLSKLNTFAKLFKKAFLSLGWIIELILTQQIILNFQQWFVSIVDDWVKKLFRVIRAYYHFYKILTEETKAKSKKIYYPINFANLHGGAKIIMKSSQKIKSISSILEDGVDKYMYTDQQLPIKFIIGLNQQVALESIIIQSYEMYSCITKQFKAQGKFTMEDKKWVYLGTFKAQNIFGDQEFYTQRKIVRYIKITIFSSYGKWSYFTLTQIKIRGKGLFADALAGNSDKIIDQEVQQSQSLKQQDDRPRDMCQNQFKLFKPLSQQPHESNLITSLITKIDNLENKNVMQSKQMQLLNGKLKDVAGLLINKTQQNKFYEQLLQEYRQQSMKTYYVLIFSLALSGMTLTCLICLCLIRRRQLAQALLTKEKLQVGVKKKSNLD